MEEKLIQCFNNSVLIPMNIRKRRKIQKIKSSSFIQKPLLISPPTPLLIKPDQDPIPVNQPQKFNPKPKPVLDLFSSVNLGSFSLNSLQDILNQLILQEQKALKNLSNRCGILEKLIKNTENFSMFSDKETRDLVSLIEEMTSTLVKTSEMEIELGVKSRLYEKINLENASLKNNYGLVLKRSQQSEHELKELREKIKNLSEENLKLQKNSENEKQRYAEVNNKIQILEESLWVFTNNNSASTQDSILKLKSAINALLKDAHYYKKEIQALRLQRDELEIKIQTLSRKIKKFKNRVADGNEPQDADQIIRSQVKHLSFLPNLNTGFN